MEKINVAELLRNCPSGMELDCTMFDDVTFYGVEDNNKISINTPCGIIQLSKNGCYHSYDYAKCVIYPKGKTSWEGFVPPRQFKDGDILHIDCTDESDDKQHEYIFILNGIYNNIVHSYCHYYIHDGFHPGATHLADDIYPIRLATEEEKAKLFDAIKANGYKWNPETKTLEKLPRFKVGDRVKSKNCPNAGSFIIVGIKEDGYKINIKNYYIKFKDQDNYELQGNYELVSDKFDITTLKPFDKVLVRGDDGQKWTHDFFGFMDEDKGCPFVCVGHYVFQCIPYEGNEHLLGKTDDCDKYFKNWK